jgi:hypothetical protein
MVFVKTVLVTPVFAKVVLVKIKRVRVGKRKYWTVKQI